MTPEPQRRKAYSYVRFSTPEQMKGDSFRRQTEAAARYAAIHGLEIDTKFNLHDLGVSAFQGRNKAVGKLGDFLTFVQSGDIAPGSYLLVENLDRVSRENALDALDTLKDIARGGITVVTLNDGREYTHESLRRNPIDLMIAVMMFMRANEESETKARRLKEAWVAKRRDAATRPMSALCPGWLRLRDDRSGFDLIPERAATVRRVFDMTLAGLGQHEIAKTFNREGVPVFGRGTMWHRSYIKKLLTEPAVLGKFTPQLVERLDGKKVRIPAEPIEGYFPAAIDGETFDRVAALSSGRGATTRNGSGMANILAGLARCPQCGSTMTRVNKGRRKKAGKPYLVCTKAKGGAGCEYRQVRLEHVEAAILDKASVLMVELPSPDDQLQGEWEGLRATDDGIGDEIDNIASAIAAFGHSPALLGRLKAAEGARGDVRKQLEEVERKLGDTLTNRTQDTVGRLVDAAEADDFDVPLINATLRQLFSAVEVDYTTGYLNFQWKHSETSTAIMYDWPRDHLSRS